jgi:hypothetical protein
MPNSWREGTPMKAWTEEELGRIGEAQELQLASERPDGTLRPHVTIWVVRLDDGLYVRSAYVGSLAHSMTIRLIPRSKG